MSTAVDKDYLFIYYNRVKSFNTAKRDRLSDGIAEHTARKLAEGLKIIKD